MTSSIGTNLARQKQKFRQQFGVDVTVLGRTLRMRTRSLKPGESAFVLDGLANIADSDLRVFEASPADFVDPKTQATVWPAVDSLLAWHGVSYTLLAAHPGDDEVAGVMVTLRLFVYRTPSGDDRSVGAAASETAQEAKWPAPPNQTSGAANSQ